MVSASKGFRDQIFPAVLQGRQNSLAARVIGVFFGTKLSSVRGSVIEMCFGCKSREAIREKFFTQDYLFPNRGVCLFDPSRHSRIHVNTFSEELGFWETRHNRGGGCGWKAPTQILGDGT